ncbi:putative [Myosin heavy-chain] kinase transcription factor WD40-like family [Helianthus debilis subsp. tardiflorus]
MCRNLRCIFFHHNFCRKFLAYLVVHSFTIYIVYIRKKTKCIICLLIYCSVYTGSADRKIKVWRRDFGEKKHKLVDTLEKHISAVNALAISTDGSVLYSGACDRSIIVWEKGGGDGRHMAVAGALRGHSKAILCIAVVDDVVFSGSADKTIRVWRRSIDGKKYWCLGVLEGHKGPIKCLAAAVEGCTSGSNGGTSYLVYGGSLDCEIKMWKLWVPFL